jgi:Ca2+-binding RTX toxin-like protein
MATVQRDVNGEITIQGSNQADIITASTHQDAGKVKVIITIQTGTKTTSYEFDESEVQRLILRGGDGDDRIIVKDDIVSTFGWEKSTAVDGSFKATLTRRVVFESELYGEAGRDHLVGGSATTLISGGSGSDRFDLSADNRTLQHFDADLGETVTAKVDSVFKVPPNQVLEKQNQTPDGLVTYQVVAQPDIAQMRSWRKPWGDPYPIWMMQPGNKFKNS